MESSIVNAVGVWFYSTSTRRYLFLLRNDARHGQCWGLAGGKCEPGETLLTTIHRECKEELGLDFVNAKFLPIEKFTSADSRFAYHTFFCQVDREFVPDINHEHFGYAWLDAGIWPAPMHPGLWSSVNFDEVRTKMSRLETDSHSTNYYLDDTVPTWKVFQALS